MPAGLVIAALVVIALVAFVAISIFNGSSESSPFADASVGPERAGE